MKLTSYQYTRSPRNITGFLHALSLGLCPRDQDRAVIPPTHSSYSDVVMQNNNAKFDCAASCVVKDGML